jgi:hypothetical protein
VNTTKTFESEWSLSTPLRVVLALGCMIAALVLAAPAGAHHSFSGFDSSVDIEQTGIVKEVKWTNPHVWLMLAIEENGEEKIYSYEGGAIAVLKRGGWFRETVSPGDKVTVIGHPFRDDRLGGSMDFVILEDGTRLAAGDAIPGALRPR